MKAILVNPKNRTIEMIEISETEFLDDTYKALNCDMIEGVYFDPNQNDVGYVDEEGRLKPEQHFMRVSGWPHPIANSMLIVGTDGEDDTDTTLSVKEVEDLITFL